MDGAPFRLMALSTASGGMAICTANIVTYFSATTQKLPQYPENGTVLTIRCGGPDLPTHVPDQTVFSPSIPKDPNWLGTHRLVILAPITGFDISWKSVDGQDGPPRIMTFSRADWEDGLIKLTN